MLNYRWVRGQERKRGALEWVGSCSCRRLEPKRVAKEAGMRWSGRSSPWQETWHRVHFLTRWVGRHGTTAEPNRLLAGCSASKSDLACCPGGRAPPTGRRFALAQLQINVFLSLFLFVISLSLSFHFVFIFFSLISYRGYYHVSSVYFLKIFIE